MASNAAARIAGPLPRKLVAAVGCDEQPGIAAARGRAPTRARPGRTGRGRRTRSASARRSAWIAAAVSSGCSATSAAIAGSRRCHAPGPWTGSWSASRRRAHDGSSRSMRSGSSACRATRARGSRSGLIPITTSDRSRSGVRGRQVERRRRPHREAEQVEGLETQRVGEGDHVGDEVGGGEAVGGIPAGRAVAAGVRPEHAEPRRQPVDRGPEADGPGRAGLVEHDQRRPVTVGRVGDLQTVRLDHRHRAAMLPPGRIAHRPYPPPPRQSPSRRSGPGPADQRRLAPRVGRRVPERPDPRVHALEVTVPTEHADVGRSADHPQVRRAVLVEEAADPADRPPLAVLPDRVPGLPSRAVAGPGLDAVGRQPREVRGRRAASASGKP